jgi:SAM-dependent methyltransferase
MTPEAERLYAAALAERPGRLVARDPAGAVVELPTARWLAGAGQADLRLLRRARGPVLDIGCGPGRHVRALAGRGIAALGIDTSPAAVRVAREQGTQVLRGSIFGPVPAAGAWRTALLLDGNVGIGGDPGALLLRVADLLAPSGAVLCECDAPGGGVRSGPLRLEHAAGASRWFPWARVAADAIDDVAQPAGLRTRARWEDDGRWFVALAAGA